MIDINHILVLTQPSFVHRQVRSALAEAEQADARGLGFWRRVLARA